METKVKILNASRLVGLTVLFIGMLLLIAGTTVSDSIVLTGIGIGTVIGATFIFLMGIFFVVTEEMLEKTFKGVTVTPVLAKKERL